MFTLNNVIAIIATCIALFFLFHSHVRTSKIWHATVTPLASIIGSGFLISAPLLLMASGHWAIWVMLAIVLLAYALGASIRFNILHVEPILNQRPRDTLISVGEAVSRPILGIAYIISVAFYLKVLSAFLLHFVPFSNRFLENCVTTSILLFIGLMGKYKGLKMLEFLEVYSVNVKLSIIIAALITCLFYNLELFHYGQWGFTAFPHETFWIGLRKILGMLIIIQGFETSRYLGYGYPPETRIKTMRYAQWISGVIYVLFIALILVAFDKVDHIDETIIIDLSGVVATIVPFLLIIMAVMSQFSAAVADTVGSGGLLSEATKHKVTEKTSYLIITSLAIALIWLTNIYQIITIASKAFAIYYAFQISLTLVAIIKLKKLKHRWLSFTFFLALLIIMLLVIVFGIPVE